MQNHSVLFVLVAVAGVILSSCWSAHTHVPPDWLADAEESALSPYGSWVEVKCDTQQVWGELIAVENDTLFVAARNLYALSLNDITSARLVTYHAADLGGYVILGSLATISNGGFLIFTMPLWLIGGSMSAGKRSYEPIIDYPERELTEFRPFARYPQGLPPSLDRQQITMKKVGTD